MSMQLFWSTDAKLVHNARKGDERAFSALVLRHMCTVESIALAYTRDWRDSQDVVQETFLKAFQQLDRLQQPGKFGPWLMSIARNCGLQALRQRPRELPLDAATIENTTADTLSIERAELVQMLQKHLEALDPDTREVLVLYYYAGRSTREIAQSLDISRDAAAKRLQRARETLGHDFMASLSGSSTTRVNDERRAKKLALAIVPTLALPHSASASTASLFGIALKSALALGVAGIAVWQTANYVGTQQNNSTPSTTTSTIMPTAPSPNNASVAAAVAVPAAPAKSSLKTTGPGSIVVTVVNNDGKPAIDAKVLIEHITWNRFEVPPTETFRVEKNVDATGTASFENLPLGSYGIIAEGNAKVWGEDAVLSAENLSAHVPMELRNGMPFQGTVHDPSGAPIAGAVLYVFGSPIISDISWNLVAVLRMVTDENGGFNRTNLVPIPVQFCIVSKDHPKTVTELVQITKKPAQFTMLPGGSVSGTVVDGATKTPQNNFAMHLSGGPANENLDFESGADGKFSVGPLQIGTYQIVVKESGYTMEAPVSAEAGTADSSIAVEVPVFLGGTVSGRVVDAETNEGIPGIVVQGYNSSDFLQMRESDPTDAQGNYVIYGLGSATYTLYPGAKDEYAALSSDTSVDVDMGQESTGVDLKMKRGKLVTGVFIENNGIGSFHAVVRLSDVNSEYKDSQRIENSGGRFSFVVPKELQSVTLSALGGISSCGENGPFDLPESGSLRVTLRGDTPRNAGIKGRVVNADGTPRPNEYIWAIMESNSTVSGPTGREILTDANGFFETSGLHPDIYWLIAGAESRELAKTQGVMVDCTANTLVDNIEIVSGANEFLTIEGRVQDPKGRPLAGVKIIPNGTGVPLGESKPDGTVVVSRLTPGEYYLEATHPLYATAYAGPLEAGSKSLAIAMRERGGVAGNVVDAETGAPIERFKIAHKQGTLVESDGELLVQWPNANTYSSTPFRQVVSKTGTFSFTKSESGETVLIVAAPGYIPDIRAIVVPEGKSVDNLDIRLHRGANLTVQVTNELGERVSNVYFSLGAHGTPSPLLQYGALMTTNINATSIGALHLTGLPPSPLTLQIYAPGYEPLESEFTPTADPNESLTVQMVPQTNVQEVTVDLVSETQ